MVTRSVVLVALVTLVSLGACELGPLDVTGLHCTEDRACGDGFTCFEARCVARGDVPDGSVDAGADGGVVDAGLDAGAPDAGRDAGVDAGGIDAGGIDAGGIDAGVDAGFPLFINLLKNPGFELASGDGGVADWVPSANAQHTLVPAAPHGGMAAGRLQPTGASQLISVSSTVVPGAGLGMNFCASVWVRTDVPGGIDVTLQLREHLVDGGIDPSNGVRVTVANAWRRVVESKATVNSALDVRVVANTRLDAGQGFWVDDAYLMRVDLAACP